MNKGNVSKAQVLSILKLKEEQAKKLDEIYIDKNGNKSHLASRKRIIEGLGLNAKDSKIVEDYVSPKKHTKPKSPFTDILELKSIQLEKLSGDEVILRIKKLKDSLNLYNQELKRRTGK